MSLARIFDAYIECALWSSWEGNAPLDSNYYPSDIEPESLAKMRAEVEDFVNSESINLEGLSDDMIGHDFWLTRNRHGAGFWDRGLGAQGEALTKASHTYGEVWLYVGDDGKIYC